MADEAPTVYTKGTGKDKQTRLVTTPAQATNAKWDGFLPEKTEDEKSKAKPAAKKAAAAPKTEAPKTDEKPADTAGASN